MKESKGIKRGDKIEKIKIGAGNGIRTRDSELGKLILYQLSYARFYFNMI